MGYEVGPLMINPWNSISDEGRPALPKKHRDDVSSIEGFKVRAERRVSILAERLGWEREKIINWSTAHALLSAWWSIEDNMDEDYSIQCARMFAVIK